MKFILASNNKKKLKEMRDILHSLGLEVISQSEAGLDIEVEETGKTFAENAFLKASEACRLTGMPAIADDSGLVVSALGGEPGVYSARYGGEGLGDEERYLHLLKNMEDAEQRGAKFVSAIVCVFPRGDMLSASGECRGEILRSARGRGGFGYDPVFFVPELGKTFAELGPEDKNEISHRGRALREFSDVLRGYLMRNGEIK
jgi:XTP/dITP diphosphohydrolase